MPSLVSLAPVLLLLATIASAQESLPVSHDVYHQIVIAHAVLAASAWVIFFPLGAILVRVVTGAALWVHISIQVFATIIFTAAWALGVWMATETQQWLASNGHPIIGTIVFGLLWLQAPLGLLHHLRWKKTGNTTIYAWIHVWLGRILITAAMINGGLGLQLSGNTTWGEILYGVVAGVVFLIYVAVSVAAAIRNRGGKRETGQKIFGSSNASNDGSEKTTARNSEQFLEKRNESALSVPAPTANTERSGNLMSSQPQQDTHGQTVLEHASVGTDAPMRMSSSTLGGNTQDIVHGGTHYSSTANRLDPHVQA